LKEHHYSCIHAPWLSFFKSRWEVISLMELVLSISAAAKYL
jgi:hypothetical protein